MPVAEVMDTWTKQMGYPVLDLSVSADAKLTQKRFLLDPKADASQPPSIFESVIQRKEKKKSHKLKSSKLSKLD